MNCNKPVKFVISSKRIFWFKVPKYGRRPCGLCSACRDFRRVVKHSRFQLINGKMEVF